MDGNPSVQVEVELSILVKELDFCIKILESKKVEVSNKEDEGVVNFWDLKGYSIYEGKGEDTIKEL